MARRIVSRRPRPPTRRPSTSDARWRRRIRPPTGPISGATLNNVGGLYADTHRFAEAEAAYKEAVDIRRALAAQNPAAYRADSPLRSTTSELSAKTRVVSPRLRPPSKRPPTSGARWRRRIRPPIGPI